MIKMQRTLITGSMRLYTRAVLWDIQSLERIIMVRKSPTYPTFYPAEQRHCLYCESSHLSGQTNLRQSFYRNSIHKCMSQPLMGRYRPGILQGIDKIRPMHQSQRYFRDLAALPTTDSFAMEYSGTWKFLVDSPPVEFVQNTLISLHSTTGLPWWALVILTPLIARTIVTLPLALYQQSIYARLSLIRLEMDYIVSDLKHTTNKAVDMFGWTETYARSMYNRSVKEQWNELVIRDNCHPMKSLILVLVQFPMWLFISAGFRNICYMFPQPNLAAHEVLMQLSTEGFGWITNLAQPDPYFILPICLGLFNLINIEVQHMLRPDEKIGRVQKIAMNIARGLSIVIVPIGGYMPACITLYWATSGAYSIVQSLVVVSPRIRRLVGIPNTEMELDHPYTHLYNNIQKKYLRKIL